MTSQLELPCVSILVDGGVGKIEDLPYTKSLPSIWLGFSEWFSRLQQVTGAGTVDPAVWKNCVTGKIGETHGSLKTGTDALAKHSSLRMSAHNALGVYSVMVFPLQTSGTL